MEKYLKSYMKQARRSRRGQSEVWGKEHVCTSRYITQLTKVPTETRNQLLIESNLKRQSICVGSDGRECDPPTDPYSFDSGVIPSVGFGTVVPISNDDKPLIPWGCWSLDFVWKCSTMKWYPSEKNQKSNEESETLDLFHHCRYPPSGKQKIFEASSIHVALN